MERIEKFETFSGQPCKYQFEAIEKKNEELKLKREQKVEQKVEKLESNDGKDLYDENMNQEEKQSFSSIE